MIVRRKGGLTEFIPSPREKREGLIRDHVLELTEDLHRRIERLERKGLVPAKLQNCSWHNKVIKSNR
jgi:hypothetical protein